MLLQEPVQVILNMFVTRCFDKIKKISRIMALIYKIVGYLLRANSF